MDRYQQRLPGLPSPPVRTEGAIGEAGKYLRQLIPFPGAEMPLLAPLPPPADALPSSIAAPLQSVVVDTPASIVSQAASILDEEMAKGVLAASGVAGAGPRHADSVTPLLRQAHEFLDGLSQAWAALPLGSLPSAASAESDAVEPIAEVAPSETVRPGQRATISMAIRNSETRAVRIVPACTDLLGTRGGRIASERLDISPSDLMLEPRQEANVTISTTVPADAAPGCYSGLLVARGVDYLRAIITIEVA